MVCWLLLSISLLMRHVEVLFAGLWSGVAFGISVVSKENAIFFAPTIFYLLSRRVRDDSQRHFAQMFWLFGAGRPIFPHFLFSPPKSALLPPPPSFYPIPPPPGPRAPLSQIVYPIHPHPGGHVPKRAASSS